MSSIIEILNQKISELGVKAIIDFYRTMAVDQLHFPGLDVFATGIGSASLNVVLDTKENNEIGAQTIDAVAGFFKSHQLPWGWFITAISKTSHIEKYGFNLLEETPGMYFDLGKALPSIAIDVEINEVHDDLKKWIAPLQEGFPSSDNCESYRKLNAALLQKNENKLRHFTAFQEHEPISSGTLFLSNDSVMLHNIATKEKFRKHGIGSSLTLYMMHEAKKAGYKHCFLDSSVDGFNMYHNLGFKVYCVTSIYVNNNR